MSKSLYDAEYIEHEDGYRIYDNGLARYKIVCERTGSGLWTIESMGNALPAPLRQQWFTNPRLAAIALKTHADQAPERQAVYRKSKKEALASEE